MVTGRVLIAGGGPVGLILSLCLARFGVASVVIERRDGPTPIDESRAITWMPRGIDLLEWLGIEAEIRDLAVLRDRHSFLVDGRPRLTLRFDRLRARHRHALDLPQGESERVLEAAALATGLVELRRGHEVVAAADGRDMASALVRAPDGSCELVEAPWAVACDGYHSALREFLSIAAVRRDYGAHSAVADLLGDGPAVPDGASWISLDPGRPHGLFRFAGDRVRLVYRINPGEDPEDMVRQDQVHRLTGLLAPGFEIRRVLWASAFRLGQQQSGSYRAGRWLLAGDAAHGMGPSAGAGLQVGALGAWRLSWRLSMALGVNAASADALMVDYCREQRAASDRVQAGNELVFRNLALRSKSLAKIRCAILSLAGSLPSAVARITASTALTDQRVPVRGASDAAAMPVTANRIARWGAWREGMRLPCDIVYAGLLTWPAAQSARHFLVGLTPTGSVAAKAICSRAGTAYAEVRSTRERRGTEAIVALVRPDQEVAALYNVG